MKQPLENKLALVTGASRGIGAAIAARLAREGAAVLVNYSASADKAEAVVKAIRAEGGQAEAVQADLSTLEGVANLLSAVDGAFDGRFKGRLDVLVNNAGTVDYGPFLESTDDSYERQFNLNV